jgi:hypothetical protein
MSGFCAGLFGCWNMDDNASEYASSPFSQPKRILEKKKNS